MKTRICLFLMMLLSASGIGQNIIPVDEKEPESGATAGAIKVLEMAEAKLATITSVEANVINTMVSELYGNETLYKGQLKFNYDPKTKNILSTWYKSEQTLKSKENHFEGIVIGKTTTEADHLTKKVRVGDYPMISPKARIRSSLHKVYWDKTFFDGMKDYTKKTGYERLKRKYTTMLEAIEEVDGKQYYVIKNRAITEHLDISRYYFGVEDGYYYGSTLEVGKGIDHKITKTWISDLKINTKLPEVFELDIPADYIVTRPTKSREIPEPLKVGTMAPNWVLKDSKGQVRKLTDFRGEIVLLDFWATWCGSCKANMPKIEKLHKSYKDKGLRILGVLAMDSKREEAAKKYFESKGYTFDLIFGNKEMDKTYGLPHLPTYIIIDREGKVVYNSVTSKSYITNSTKYEYWSNLVEEYL